jgi:peptide/nickel transport system permease protein
MALSPTVHIDAASPPARLARKPKRNAFTLFGGALVAVVALASILANVISSYAPTTANPTAVLQGPSATHWFGTDAYGFDIFSRVVYAGRIDLVVALLAMVLAMVAGVLIGGSAGYVGGLIDEVLMRVIDVLSAFPTFILAMILIVALGPSVPDLVVAVGVAEVPAVARLVRSRVVSVRSTHLVPAARLTGSSEWRILIRHVLPNSLGPAFVQSALVASYAILAVSGLSFIDLGVRLPTAEWGVMVQQGVQYLTTGQWWVSFFPGLAIGLTILGLNLLGDGIADAYGAGGR